MNEVLEKISREYFLRIEKTPASNITLSKDNHNPLPEKKNYLVFWFLQSASERARTDLFIKLLKYNSQLNSELVSEQRIDPSLFH